MRLWIGCLFAGLVFFTAIIGVTYTIVKSREKYALLRNVGKFPLRHIRKKKRHTTDSDGDHKYSGARYKRHRVRSNPHVRRYQD